MAKDTNRDREMEQQIIQELQNAGIITKNMPHDQLRNQASNIVASRARARERVGGEAEVTACYDSDKYFCVMK